jgi:hypothetical protein
VFDYCPAPPTKKNKCKNNIDEIHFNCIVSYIIHVTKDMVAKTFVLLMFDARKSILV